MDSKPVRNGRWCIPTPLMHGLVVEYDNALPVTTSSVEEPWKKIHHGAEGEGL